MKKSVEMCIPNVSFQNNSTYLSCTNLASNGYPENRVVLINKDEIDDKNTFKMKMLR